MTAKGHLALALLPALFISKALPPQEQTIFLSSVGVGSILPDIDEPGSYIGRKLAFLSIPLKLFGIKHRTFTHYLIFPLIVAIIGLFLPHPLNIAAFGLAFGILMHDVGDMLTRGGIKGFLYPCCKDKTFRLLPKNLAFYTNSITEWILISILYIIDLYLYVKLNLDINIEAIL